MVLDNGGAPRRGATRETANTEKGGEQLMGKFLVVHTLPAPATIEELAPVGKAAKAYSTLDAYWVGAWSQLDEKGKVTRIFCEWDAKDVASIRKVFDAILKKVPVPVDGIWPMTRVEAEAYR